MRANSYFQEIHTAVFWSQAHEVCGLLSHDSHPHTCTRREGANAQANRANLMASGLGSEGRGHSHRLPVPAAFRQASSDFHLKEGTGGRGGGGGAELKGKRTHGHGQWCGDC